MGRGHLGGKFHAFRHPGPCFQGILIGLENGGPRPWVRKRGFAGLYSHSGGHHCGNYPGGVEPQTKGNPKHPRWGQSPRIGGFRLEGGPRKPVKRQKFPGGQKKKFPGSPGQKKNRAQRRGSPKTPPRGEKNPGSPGGQI